MINILKISVLLFLPFYSFAQKIDQLNQNSQNSKELQIIDSLLLKNSSDPNLYLKQGIVHEKRFEYAKALKSFEKAYQLDSAQTAILNELSETNSNLGNYRQALPYYKKIFDLDTLNTVNAIRLSRAFFNIRNYQEPFLILFNAYQRDSSNVYVNKLLAFSAMRTGNDSLAIELYKRVIPQNPTDLNNYINLASLYQMQNMYDQAVETLENGILAFPEETLLLNRLGDLHYSKRIYKKAIAQYEKLIATGDSLPGVIKNLGISHYYEKEFKKGIELLEKSLTLVPNDPVAGLFIGLCYKNLKDNDQSLAYLNFAAKIGIPSYMSDIYNQLGNIYTEKKAYGKSVEFLKKAYQLDSTKVDILFKIANNYDLWLPKDKSQAIKYYNAYLKSDKEKNDYHRQMTKYALERKQKIRK
ncbi:MAG: tetratricopeptide repeat protein [Prolixibacteraceae bacterium]|jgi:tetratricopeptide (TPR) repeat protein|nr:tetratricopeptide repeat protein [Prolixibacteraceae bacterium]